MHCFTRLKAFNSKKITILTKLFAETKPDIISNTLGKVGSPRVRQARKLQVG